VEGLMTDARYMYTAGIPATRVGALVARVRLARGVTERAVAARLRVPVRTVRDWERGHIVPTDDQIEAIALACGVHVTDLLPRRGALTYDPTTGVLQLGSQSTVLSTATRSNDDVLVAFLSLVRLERGVRPDREITVRGDDLEALADALDLDDDELEERFVRIVGLSRKHAAAVRAQMLRRRLTVGVVGMLAGISLVAANRAFTTGTERVDAVGGGGVVRGNPFVAVTTAVARAVTTTAPSETTTIVISSAAPQSTTASATVPPVTAAPGPPPTLPAVVLAEQVKSETGPAGRTGPPRTTPRPEFSLPVTQPTEPVTTTTPTTVALPGPSTLDPPATTGAPATTTATTGPPDTPPVATTSGPAVPPIGGGGTTATTEAPPPTTTTTTTTEPPPTTTTTEPPTTTTTEPPPTTTTTAEPPTTTTTQAPPATPSGR
jgi:transcriptional regulator with XRE-family HTH domain